MPRLISNQVPHHGSDVTADAEFYRLVRAQVYLISGRQASNGAPSLETLKAIVSGFRQAPGTYDANAPPYYLFFSDARTLDPVAGRDSNTLQLLKISLDYDPRISPARLDCTPLSRVRHIVHNSSTKVLL
jgi:hypothetical protein